VVSGNFPLQPDTLRFPMLMPSRINPFFSIAFLRWARPVLVVTLLNLVDLMGEGSLEEVEEALVLSFFLDFFFSLGASRISSPFLGGSARVLAGPTKRSIDFLGTQCPTKF